MSCDDGDELSDWVPLPEALTCQGRWFFAVSALL